MAIFFGLLKAALFVCWDGISNSKSISSEPVLLSDNLAIAKFCGIKLIAGWLGNLCFHFSNALILVEALLSYCLVMLAKYSQPFNSSLLSSLCNERKVL